MPQFYLFYFCEKCNRQFVGNSPFIPTPGNLVPSACYHTCGTAGPLVSIIEDKKHAQSEDQTGSQDEEAGSTGTTPESK